MWALQQSEVRYKAISNVVHISVRNVLPRTIPSSTPIKLTVSHRRSKTFLKYDVKDNNINNIFVNSFGELSMDE